MSDDTGESNVAEVSVNPYDLYLFEDEAWSRDSLVHGVVRNTGTERWSDRHRVGLRDFRDAAGDVIPGFELRAKMTRTVVEPGEQAAFSIDLATADVPGTAARCSLDVVEEGVRWLGMNGNGGDPIEIVFSEAAEPSLEDWLLGLRQLEQGAPPAVVGRLRLLGNALQRFDFGHLEDLRSLRKAVKDEKAGRPFRPLRPDSAVVLATLGAGAGDAALFLRHFAVISGQRIDTAQPESAARLFAPFVAGARSLFRGGCPPLPAELCAWLAKRAVPPALGSTPATRSIMATLGRLGPFDLNPGDGGREQLWLFACRMLIDCSVTAAAIPPPVSRAFAVSPPNMSADHGLPLRTGFLAAVGADDPDYRARYDSTKEVGLLGLVINKLIDFLENEAGRHFLGEDILAWLTDPLSDSLPFSIAELLLLALTGAPAPLSGPAELEAQAAAMRVLVPWLAPARVPRAAPALRLLGEYRSPTGLGVNMRMSQQALASIGIAPEILDVTGETLLRPAMPGGAFPASRNVNLFHLNLDAVPALHCRFCDVSRSDAYNIGFALWESSTMPEEHRAGLELVDEIWAPTEFVADVYREAGHPNIHVVGKGIDLPAPRPFDMREIGIGEGIFCYLLSFDVGSWINRKNPWAAVSAFLKAFPHDPSVRLVIKTNGLHSHASDIAGQVERIEAAAEADPRIVLISRMMPFANYLGLIATADAVVSPHRAEGFGYLAAYAMLLETPLIVTDFSGTRDFCTADTSYPVRARLVTIPPREFIYDAPGAQWADVDVDAMADAMIAVRENRGETAAKAARGKVLVAERYSMTSLARRYAARLAAI